jgi:hypothetical protein
MSSLAVATHADERRTVLGTVHRTATPVTRALLTATNS